MYSVWTIYLQTGWHVLKITKVRRGQRSAFKVFKKTSGRDPSALFNPQTTKICVLFFQAFLLFASLLPSYFSSRHQLVMSTLFSKLRTVFSLLLVIPALLHTVLTPELFSHLAKSPALLVFLAGTLTSVPVVCRLRGK